jgi:hypothetical protein
VTLGECVECVGDVLDMIGAQRFDEFGEWLDDYGVPDDERAALEAGMRAELTAWRADTLERLAAWLAEFDTPPTVH